MSAAETMLTAHDVVVLGEEAMARRTAPWTRGRRARAWSRRTWCGIEDAVAGVVVFGLLLAVGFAVLAGVVTVAWMWVPADVAWERVALAWSWFWSPVHLLLAAALLAAAGWLVGRRR